MSCLKSARAFERGEEPAKVDVPDAVAKQLLSRAPGGSTNFLRAAIEDTIIISMKGV